MRACAVSVHHREHESQCSVDTLECVVTAGHALWSIMAQLMDGRPLAIGQAAGFHSCGQVHRDLSAAPPRDRRADRDEWAQGRPALFILQGCVSVALQFLEIGALSAQNVVGRTASLLRPTLSFAMVLPAASDTASQVVTLARAQHQTWQRMLSGCIGGTKQFLAVRHRATHRILLCCPTLQAFPARHRIVAGLKGANGSASVQQLYQKRSHHLLLRVGGRDSLQDCGDEQSAEV